MLPEKWTDLTNRFWLLRGVATAFAILAIATQGLSWESLSFLRAVHAFLFSWNSIADIFGSFIGKFINIKINAAEINSLIIILALVIPANFAFYYKGQDRTFYIRWWFHFIIMTPLYYIYFVWVFNSRDSAILSLIVILAAGLLNFRKLFIRFPSYTKGIISAVIFLATMQILYFLHLPVLRQKIDNYSCRALNIPKNEC